MLGQIANYTPIIARNTIVNNSTTLRDIWQIIRLHYGFQSTGAHFLDFCNIKLEPNERPEDLFQRLMAFTEDNLLTTESGITHNGQEIAEDEELTSTMENFIVLTWLTLIHPDLPRLVKQRYGTELRSRTLATLKPEISQALDSLLEELKNTEDARAMRTQLSSVKKASSNQKICPLCKAFGRPSTHFLSKCVYLPHSDKKYFAKARKIMETEGDPNDGDNETHISPKISV
jgi:hypothetical protein